jgi:hypothetical protein
MIESRGEGWTKYMIEFPEPSGSGLGQESRDQEVFFLLEKPEEKDFIPLSF